MSDSSAACTLCGASGAVPTTTTLTFTEVGATVTVAGVPASRCGTCDDVAIAGPLALAIERDARHILELIAEHAPVAVTGRSVS